MRSRSKTLRLLLSLGLASCNPFETEASSSSDPSDPTPFSFFYTSLDAMRRLSGSENGFGGDLRFGNPPV